MCIHLRISYCSILFNGQKFDNNKFTSKTEQKLKREQRKLSKRALIAKKMGSIYLKLRTIKNKKKKVAGLYEK